MNRFLPLACALLCSGCPSNESPPQGAEKKADQKSAAKAAPEQPPAPKEPEPPKVDPELHDAYDEICNAAERSGANAETDPNERIVKTAEWIKAEVKNQEAIDLMGSLATMDPSRRSDALRDAAKKAGVDPCPMADEN